MEFSEVTWTAIANGSAVWILQVMAEVAKWIGFKGNALRISTLTIGIALTTAANGFVSGWTADGVVLGVIKGIVWSAIAMGLYARIKGGERS